MTNVHFSTVLQGSTDGATKEANAWRTAINPANRSSTSPFCPISSPNQRAVFSEIINLQAILNLPKSTEHFMSDLHGGVRGFSAHPEQLLRRHP